MTAVELRDLMDKMENIEKNRFLDKLYDDYFDKRIPFEILKERERIISMYLDGELVEVEQHEYS